MRFDSQLLIHAILRNSRWIVSGYVWHLIFFWYNRYRILWLPPPTTLWHLLVFFFDIVTIFPIPKSQFQYCSVIALWHLVSVLIGYCDYFGHVPRYPIPTVVVTWIVLYRWCANVSIVLLKALLNDYSIVWHCWLNTQLQWETRLGFHFPQNCLIIQRE